MGTSENTTPVASRTDRTEFLSVDRTAEMLGLSRRQIYNLISVGTIPAVRVGQRLRVPADELRQRLEAHRVS